MPLSQTVMQQFAGGTLEINSQQYPIESIWTSPGALHVVFAAGAVVPFSNIS